MLRVRRTDLSPRVEMTPLIDVIFLLLTFFIYSLVVMVRAQVLPVALTPVTTGRAAEPTQIAAITIDRTGGLYLDRKPIAGEALDEKLRAFAAAESPPKLFVAMEETPAPGIPPLADSGAGVDRGPLLIALIERLRTAGLTDFSIVGREGAAEAGD